MADTVARTRLRIALAAAALLAVVGAMMVVLAPSPADAQTAPSAPYLRPLIAPLPPPSTSTGPIVPVTATSVELQWLQQTNAGITKYQYRKRLPESSGTKWPTQWTGGWTDMPGANPRSGTYGGGYNFMGRYEVTGLNPDTEYQFQMRLVAGNTNSEPSADRRTVTTDLSPAPIWDASKIVETTTSMKLVWTISTNAGIVKYQYRQRKHASGPPFPAWPDSWTGGWQDIPGSSASTTSYAITGLDDEPYQWEIRAISGPAGTSIGYPSGRWIKILYTDPGDPPSYQDSAPLWGTRSVTNTSVTLNWTVSSNAGITKYQYRQRKETSGEWGTWAGWADMAGSGASTTSHTITGLDPGTRYQFRIRANEDGPASTDITAATHATSSEAAPYPLWGNQITATYTTTTIRWTLSDNTGVTKYQYRQRKQTEKPSSANPQGVWGDWGDWGDIAGSDANTTSHTATGLVPNTNYQHQIRANKGNIDGTASTAYTKETLPIPQPRMLPGQYVVTGTAVTLKWTYPLAHASEFTKFQVRYKFSNKLTIFGPAAWVDVSGGISANSYQVTGLGDGLEYLFQVRAVIGGGEGNAADSIVTAGQPETARARTYTSTVQAPLTPMPPCVLEQAGPDGSPAAKSCERTILTTRTSIINAVWASGETGTLASSSPSVKGRVVTFEPSAPGDNSTGAAVYHIVVTTNEGVEIARYEITVTTYAAGQAPALARTAPKNVYKIEFVGDADGVAQPGQRVRLKVTRVDGVAMVHGTTFESVEISDLSLTAVRRFWYPDDTRKFDHDGDSGTPMKGDADDKPDVDTLTVEIGRKFAVDHLVFRERRATRYGMPRLQRNEVRSGQLLGDACFSKPKDQNAASSNPPVYGNGTWDFCDADDNRFKRGEPYTAEHGMDIVVPPDAPSGQYVVTVKGPRDPEGTTMVTETRTLTVGTPPAVGTVRFGLSSPRRAQPGETAATNGYLNDLTTREPATIAAGGSLNTELTLSVLNANNQAAEASTVSSIVVTTTLGTLASKAGQTPTCAGGATCAFDLSGLKSSGGALPEKGLRMLLTSPAAPGTATVTAMVVSGGKVLRPSAVQVRFSGAATTLTIGAAPSHVLGYNVGNDEAANYNAATKADTGMDARDQITFAVDATDASGSAIKTPTLNAMVKTSSGTLVAQSKYETTQSGSMMNRLMLDIDAALASALAAGTYTLEVTSGTLKATTTFMVVGAADSVELTLDPTTATEIGQGVRASVLVVDAAGNAVADGTMVTFGASDLVGDDDAVVVLDDTSALTVAGKAATTLSVVGAGRAVVRATVSDDSTPERDVAVLVSTAGAAAMPSSAEAGLDCLSALSGFATWVCAVDTTASEVFGLVSGRGASAVHLWSGSAWIRYSVVGGTMVPGSSDFMVGENDILYISN